MINFLSLINLEILKQRRSSIFIFVVLGPLAALLLSFFPALTDEQLSAARWIRSMWRIWAIFIGPIFMSLYCGSLANIEYADTRWDALRLSIYSPESAYLAKFAVAGICFVGSNALMVVFSLFINKFVAPATDSSLSFSFSFLITFSLSGLWLLSIFWCISMLTSNVLILHAISVVGTLASGMLRASGSPIFAKTPWGVMPFYDGQGHYGSAAAGLFAACFTVSIALIYFGRYPPGRERI